MGRRNDIDWEKIHKLYVANQMTVREIAADCGVNASSITLKAKQNGWKRNLDVAIKERTKAKLAAIDVQELIEQSAQQSANKSAQTIQSAIEQASNNAANIRLRQRADIKTEADRSAALQVILENELSNLDGIGDVLKATQAYKNLVEARLKLQDREDSIFGLKDDDDDKTSEPLSIVVNGVKVDG
jgi:hypothetical protein